MTHKPYIPASEIMGAPHTGVAVALERLIVPLEAALPGDIVAVGCGLLLTPDDILITDSSMYIYILRSNGYIEVCDILDVVAPSPQCQRGITLRSLHFMLMTDSDIELSLHTAALEISPHRTSSLSLEFIMTGEALLLSKSDLRQAFMDRNANTKFTSNLGDVMRSLWFAPTEYPDRIAEHTRAKSLNAFLADFCPLQSDSGKPLRISVALPRWEEEQNEVLEYLPYASSVHVA